MSMNWVFSTDFKEVKNENFIVLWEKYLVLLLQSSEYFTVAAATATNIRPLSQEEISNMNDAKVKIRDRMRADDILKHLLSDKCITFTEMNNIKHQANNSARNELLIDIFTRRSYADFERLINWLKQTEQIYEAIVLSSNKVGGRLCQPMFLYGFALSKEVKICVDG